MFALAQLILLIIWLIDVFNIDFIINGVHIAQWLDVTVPLNGWFWFLLWLLMPTGRIIVKEDK